MNRVFGAAVIAACIALAEPLFYSGAQAIAQSNFIANTRVKVGRYFMQSPSGYRLESIAGLPEPAYGYALVGPTRSDGTQGQVLAIYRPITGIEPPNIEDVMRKRLAATQKNYVNWLQSGLEVVTVNGLAFYRIRWSGTHRTQNVTLQGFLYVTLHQNEIIYLSSQDLFTHQNDLNRAHFSVLSFSP